MQRYGSIARVNDTEINVYTEGNGNTTIIFLAGSGVGCPVLEYKPVYRRMSDRYRIAVIEKAGYGLSGDATTERTVENLVEESRAALRILNIRPPYILAPHSYSGFEAIWWANTYPEEVKAVLGLDMGLPNMMRAQAKEIPEEKKKAMVGKTRVLMHKIAKRGLLAKILRNNRACSIVMNSLRKKKRFTRKYITKILQVRQCFRNQYLPKRMLLRQTLQVI